MTDRQRVIQQTSIGQDLASSSGGGQRPPEDGRTRLQRAVGQKVGWDRALREVRRHQTSAERQVMGRDEHVLPAPGARLEDRERQDDCDRQSEGAQHSTVAEEQDLQLSRQHGSHEAAT
jgi:hypothetical protein